MTTEEKIKTARIPLGTWALDGTWKHNPDLKMPAEQQFLHNLKYGFTMNHDFSFIPVVDYNSQYMAT